MYLKKRTVLTFRSPWHELHRSADHSIKVRDLLKDAVDEEIIEATMAHNYENTEVSIDSICWHAPWVMPSKKVADVKLESLMKKFRSKDFAKGVSRERLSRCTEQGLCLGEFLELHSTE